MDGNEGAGGSRGNGEARKQESGKELMGTGMQGAAGAFAKLLGVMSAYYPRKRLRYF